MLLVNNYSIFVKILMLKVGDKLNRVLILEYMFEVEYTIMVEVPSSRMFHNSILHITLYSIIIYII